MVAFLSLRTKYLSMTTTVSSTPAQRRREKVRTSILRAAEKVFAKEGEEGLSIRRIAEAIDYSPAAIYKYFSSKDALVDELKEVFFAEILEKADALKTHEGSFSERARLCLRTYVETALAKSHHYAAAFSGKMDKPPMSLEDFSESNKGQAFLILLDMVQEGQELGELRKDLEPTDAARSLWASCHGLASLMIHWPSFPAADVASTVSAREALIDLHTDLVMRGLEQSHDANRNKLTKTSSPKRKR